MTSEQLQAECEKGQAQLMRMEYLEAEATLAAAERQAWAARDWDALARLYMPLQEARRQRRQRCGEGIVCLDLLAESPADAIDPLHVVKNYSHGQLLVAGWGDTTPAVRVRDMAAAHHLFLDTFLAAVYPSDKGGMVAIIPLGGVKLPDPVLYSLDELKRLLPAHSILLRDDELPRGSQPGTYKTYGQVMAIWERLHAPFVAAADAQTDPILKMEGYRTAIRVDAACELAHQKLSDTARRMR
jgi:hypothetical protein